MAYMHGLKESCADACFRSNRVTTMAATAPTPLRTTTTTAATTTVCYNCPSLWGGSSRATCGPTSCADKQKAESNTHTLTHTHTHRSNATRHNTHSHQLHTMHPLLFQIPSSPLLGPSFPYPPPPAKYCCCCHWDNTGGGGKKKT